MTSVHIIVKYTCLCRITLHSHTMHTCIGGKFGVHQLTTREYLKLECFINDPRSDSYTVTSIVLLTQLLPPHSPM